MPAPDARPRVRLATPADGAACAAIYAPYVTDTAISFELVPPDAAEISARIARTIERTPWVVVEVDGVVRAYAYGMRHRERAAYDWTVETTVYVDREFTRAGLGRIAMSAVLAVLRLQGAHLAVAGITQPNPGSSGLHVALGFRRVGEFEAIGWKDGAWHGVEWFAQELGPRDGAPMPLVPLPDLVETPEIEAALAGCV
ncbi:MAG TPA: GNAT family N-acetyltransferase [Candidatus Limnocylindrales bacterium]|nr:GNAT family N-acetyltransferase [Candidatus Limnocylindrales bacterium]